MKITIVRFEFPLKDSLSLGGCSTSTSGWARVIPKQEDQTDPGSHRREGNTKQWDVWPEGYAGGQGEEDQHPAEKGTPGIFEMYQWVLKYPTYALNDEHFVPLKSSFTNWFFYSTVADCTKTNICRKPHNTQLLKTDWQYD